MEYEILILNNMILMVFYLFIFPAFAVCMKVVRITAIKCF